MEELQKEGSPACAERFGKEKPHVQDAVMAALAVHNPPSCRAAEMRGRRLGARLRDVSQA